MIEHVKFPKIGRYREQNVVVTEKIDGTNGLIYIDSESSTFLVGSRNRWITPDDDNAGFARFAYDNREDLYSLGDGFHYGEWWGQGIQRRYGMDRKVFSLFNHSRWEHAEDRPECCDVVPLVFTGTAQDYDQFFEKTVEGGTVSIAAAKYGVNFTQVEGFMVWFCNTKQYMKHIIDK